MTNPSQKGREQNKEQKNRGNTLDIFPLSIINHLCSPSQILQLFLSKRFSMIWAVQIQPNSITEESHTTYTPSKGDRS